MMPSDMWVNRVLGHILLIRGLGLAIPAHIRLQRKVGKKNMQYERNYTSFMAH